MRQITLIAAVSINGVIGNDNDIPWKCQEDLRHFKNTTKGKVVLMGRKTWDSLGRKPLPGRINVVVSRHHDFGEVERLDLINVIYVPSVGGIFDCGLIDPGEVFVIGGAEIYRQMMPDAQRMIISHIHIPVEGDVKFPDFDLDEWGVEKIDHRLNGEIPFTIVTYIRKPQ